jgi:adenosylcobinamide-GDP ribazoletransferase
VADFGFAARRTLVNAVRPVAIAFGFLTRLPGGSPDVRTEDFGRSISCFPLVGLALGALLALAAWLLRGHWSPELRAVALVALLAALTGGLHLDGLADVFDGLSGGRGDRQRMLSIMRDSRIGALGSVALFLVLFAKVFALAEVLRRGAFWPLLVFPMASRWAAAALLVFFPYARSDGLGKTFTSQVRPVHFLVATLIAAAVLVPAGLRLALASAVGLGVALCLGLWIKSRLGGLTGDVYGAAIELSEVAVLLAA